LRLNATVADQHPVVTEATTADVPAVSTFFWDAWRQAGPDSPGFAGATEDVIAEITTPELIRSRLGGRTGVCISPSRTTVL
jgi:hypothetical protein